MGHKANISSLDFHPMGEYLASGSVDSNIKVSCFLDLVALQLIKFLRITAYSRSLVVCA